MRRFRPAPIPPSHLAALNPLFLWTSFSGHLLLQLKCEAYLAVRQSHDFRRARLNRHIFMARASSGIFRAHHGSSGIKTLFLPAFPSLYISMAAKIMDRHRYLSRAMRSKTATKNCYDPNRGGVRKCLNYLKVVVLAGMVGFEPTVHCTKNSCLTTWLHPNVWA